MWWCNEDDRNTSIASYCSPYRCFRRVAKHHLYGDIWTSLCLRRTARVQAGNRPEGNTNKQEGKRTRHMVVYIRKIYVYWTSKPWLISYSDTGTRSRETHSALSLFSFPSVFYTCSCVCWRSWKLREVKVHTNGSSSSVVLLLIMWLCDITLRHHATCLLSECLPTLIPT